MRASGLERQAPHVCRRRAVTLREEERKAGRVGRVTEPAEVHPGGRALVRAVQAAQDATACESALCRSTRP